MGTKGDWRRPVDELHKKEYEQTLRRLYDKCSVCANKEACTTKRDNMTKCQMFIEEGA